MSHPRETFTDVVVVGAGVSGLRAAADIKNVFKLNVRESSSSTWACHISWHFGARLLGTSQLPARGGVPRPRNRPAAHAPAARLSPLPCTRSGAGGAAAHRRVRGAVAARVTVSGGARRRLRRPSARGAHPLRHCRGAQLPGGPRHRKRLKPAAAVRCGSFSTTPSGSPTTPSRFKPTPIPLAPLYPQARQAGHDLPARPRGGGGRRVHSRRHQPAQRAVRGERAATARTTHGTSAAHHGAAHPVAPC
jgi:hypothetical protein